MCGKVFHKSYPTSTIKEETGCNLLKAAEYHSWFFVTGLKPGTTQDDLQKYLDLHGVCGSIIKKVLTKKDRIKSSFKISVSRSQREKIMKPEFWPAGISINHFLNLHQRRSHMRVPTIPDREKANKF